MLIQQYYFLYSMNAVYFTISCLYKCLSQFSGFRKIQLSHCWAETRSCHQQGRCMGGNTLTVHQNATHIDPFLQGRETGGLWEVFRHGRQNQRPYPPPVTCFGHCWVETQSSHRHWVGEQNMTQSQTQLYASYYTTQLQEQQPAS